MPQSVHDTLPPRFGQLQVVIQAEWEQEVLAQLPADTEEQASQLGAFVRRRGLMCVGDLLPHPVWSLSVGFLFSDLIFEQVD